MEVAVNRVIGRLAAVFRRSRSGSRPAALTVATPSPVPRSPALVVAGTHFAPVARVKEFTAAVPAQQRIALRLPTTGYGTVMRKLMHWFKMRKLMHWFNASEYGEASPEYRAIRHAVLACADCGWEFPGSYVGSLLGMYDRCSVIGATSGFAEFGRTGKCTRCGSGESFLLYECIDPAGIDEEDLAALARLWRDDARRWWSRTGRAKAICDLCNSDMRAGEGSLISLNSLACEQCLRRLLDGGLEELRANPYNYGATELRRARQFRTGGATAAGGLPAADDIEHVLVLWDEPEPDTAELEDLIESVVPGATARGMQLNIADSPGLSRGWAYWDVYVDEMAGRLTLGAWRRTWLTVRDGGSGRGRRLVAVVAAAKPDAAEPAPARQEWAREMIFRHVARMELELQPDLMDRPTWCQLLSPEVLDFVLDIDPDEAIAVPGTAHPFRAQTFGDLSVLVSLFEVAEADQIRDLMAGGWESYLDKLLDAAGIRLGERDVAHWILCQEPGHGARVHLAYLPAAAGNAFVPVDLLAPMEPGTPQ